MRCTERLSDDSSSTLALIRVIALLDSLLPYITAPFFWMRYVGGSGNRVERGSGSVETSGGSASGGNIGKGLPEDDRKSSGNDPDATEVVGRVEKVPRAFRRDNSFEER